MRYFTDELCSKTNSDKEEDRIEAEKQWKKNSKEYHRLFEKIKYRIPKTSLMVYEKHRFHDYNLDEIRITQARFGTKYPLKIVLVISNEDMKFEILYKNITKLEIMHNVNKEAYWEWWSGFHTWGYDEFFEVNDKILSHEILFALGATILIHFQKIKISKIKE